jgi:hypothetical protein
MCNIKIHNALKRTTPYFIMLLGKVAIINLLIAKMILPYAIMAMFLFSQNVYIMAYVVTSCLSLPLN